MGKCVHRETSSLLQSEEREMNIGMLGLKIRAYGLSRGKSLKLLEMKGFGNAAAERQED